ncbi:MAG: hypothetical protein QOE58_3542 [Actinomycetota bacterium]|nr:hypothetical protein [Actinomycetota bacterium]
MPAKFVDVPHQPFKLTEFVARDYLKIVPKNRVNVIERDEKARAEDTHLLDTDDV